MNGKRTCGLPALALALALVSTLAACDDAGGGTGGRASIATTAAGPTSGSFSTANETTSGFLDCKQPSGLIGSLQCNACAACVDDEGFCKSYIDDLATVPSAANWTLCVYGDGDGAPGCPADEATTMNDEFEDCVAECDTLYPTVRARWLKVVSCIYCNQCSNACNVDGALGSCSELPPAGVWPAGMPPI